ncbi:Electron transfer DM13 [Roseovarius litoreus]|uniref:Electron transfer DM13 n=1 Tax=Roseovarius litoreus TaxID=1155722 RepID=A0A1M7HUF0_9RHOB|nr:DM13 domain-containing protein [Roseovarius litoreus]SHM32105.1 Electron transfer DM13 [Roseovarius litoreus]
MRKLVLLVSHLAMLGVGFGLGIYLLPILTAPPAPEAAMLQEKALSAQYSAEFTRDLEGSDFLHWGEGTVSLSPTEIVHQGRLAPGPDYRLYLVPQFVETEAQFEAVRSDALDIGQIKSFDGFLIAVPEGVDLDAYTTVLVWCEAFGEFITAAAYR